MNEKQFYAAYCDWNYNEMIPRFGWCWRSGNYEYIKNFVEEHEYCNAIMFDSYKELKDFILGRDTDETLPQWIHIPK